MQRFFVISNRRRIVFALRPSKSFVCCIIFINFFFFLKFIWRWFCSTLCKTFAKLALQRDEPNEKMTLSVRAAKCAALMSEQDELYPGFEMKNKIFQMCEKMLKRFLISFVAERILYPRNTRTLSKTPVTGGTPIDEETCLVSFLKNSFVRYEWGFFLSDFLFSQKYLKDYGKFWEIVKCLRLCGCWFSGVRLALRNQSGRERDLR